MAQYKELILLRHGKSDWSTNDSDFYRPLNKRGKQNVKQMGRWLEQQALLPDLILSSPATRALSTAERICQALNIATDCIETDKSIYEAKLSDLLQVLSQVPNSVQRLYLVGHNPGLENLLLHFVPTHSSSGDGKLLPTATVAYLQLNSTWSSLKAKCLIQRPKDLPL